MTKRININDIDAFSYGGGHIIINILNKKGVHNFIDNKLGKRAPRATKFTYSDAIYSWFVTKCRGVKSFESMHRVKKELESNPKFKKGMSPDTLLYICKELSQTDYEPAKNESKPEDKYKNYQLNRIDRFNELLIELILFLGILNTRETYIIDYDTTPIETKNSDARKWYGGMGRTAYMPAVAMINKIPIYVENRNGDTNPSFGLLENIKIIVSLLKKYGIKIKLIRIDAAGSTRDFTKYASDNGISYITKPKGSTIKKHIEQIQNWKNIQFKSENLNIGSGYFIYGDSEQRFIINNQTSNSKNEDETVKHQWGLMTNIEDLTPKEIIRIYRDRGTSEQLFSDLNQMGWNRLRMHKFSYNTVYLYITCLNAIIHKYLKRTLTNKKAGINENIEFDTFRNIIMPIPILWIENKMRILTKDPIYKFLSGFT